MDLQTCFVITEDVCVQEQFGGYGRTIRWDSGICLLPGRLGFLVRFIYAPT